MSKLRIEWAQRRGIGTDQEAREIRVGEVFEAEAPDTDKLTVFLKIYDGIVSLENPGQTWTSVSPRLRRYRPLRVTLVIEGPDDE